MLKFLQTTLLLIIFTFQVQLNAQQTVGLFVNEESAYEGYTLFAPMFSTKTFLINNCGEKVHSWPSTYLTGHSVYLLENGILLRAGRNSGITDPGGIVEMINWNGEVIWDYSTTGSFGSQHHDIAPLPNGNILLIVWDERSPAEVELAGSSTTQDHVDSEQIIEVKPNLITGGAEVVWVWKAWDHIIQDVDSTKANFGVVSENPNKIDINYLSHENSDWLHFNGIDYNAELDQISLSCHSFSEFWIIDHSTSMEEAATDSGGYHGKGGDLIYRWGNPIAYDQGTLEDQKLFLQHNPHWIPNEYRDGGKILLFNNQLSTENLERYSTVDIVNPPIDEDDFYVYDEGAYGPVDFDWTYQETNPTDFVSRIISGAQRLENGNTLICEGIWGRFFEVDTNKNIVWEYINPVDQNGIIPQFEEVSGNNWSFRCTKYGIDYPAFDGKDLSSQGYIETGNNFNCDGDTTPIEEPTAIFETEESFSFEVYPNPANDWLKINYKESNQNQFVVQLLHTNGQLIQTHQLNRAELSSPIDVSNLANGIYIIQVTTEKAKWVEQFVISK